MRLHLATAPDGTERANGSPRCLAEGLKLHLASGGGSPARSGYDAIDLSGGLKLHLAVGNSEGGNSSPPSLAEALANREGDGLRLRMLVSYHYFRDTDLDDLLGRYFGAPYPELFADSGAFSAATQGAPLDVDAYAAWLKRWRHLFTTYSNLDVIRDPAATAWHQAILEDRHGLEPLPVFHAGSPYRELENLIDRYPYIALGGLVGFSAVYMAHLVRCFKLAEGRAVFHGFGVTSWKALLALPWYSADSSSWCQGFKYGQVPTFDERLGKWVKLRLGDRASCLKHAALIRRLGFDPADFAVRSRNERAKVCALSALSYMRAERWLRRRHGPIAIPSRCSFERDGEGLKLHLAYNGERTVEADHRGLGRVHREGQ